MYLDWCDKEISIQNLIYARTRDGDWDEAHKSEVQHGLARAVGRSNFFIWTKENGDSPFCAAELDGQAQHKATVRYYEISFSAMIKQITTVFFPVDGVVNLLKMALRVEKGDFDEFSDATPMSIPAGGQRKTHAVDGVSRMPLQASGPSRLKL